MKEDGEREEGGRASRQASRQAGRLAESERV